jgi:hypothetical protein
MMLPPVPSKAKKFVHTSSSAPPSETMMLHHPTPKIAISQASHPEALEEEKVVPTPERLQKR